MQAVILAAGKSTRMYPYNDGLHKSLLTICGKTILQHTIESVKKSGITDILLVTSDSTKMQETIKDYADINVSIQCVEMKEPTGAGDAVLLCKKYLQGNFFLLNASRVDFADYKKPMEEKFAGSQAVLLGKQESFLEKYGAMHAVNGKVADLVEKPQEYDSFWLRVIGIYLLSEKFVDHLEKTPRDHYSLENALKTFAKIETVRALEIKKDVASLKYAWDLLSLKTYLLQKQTPHISKKAVIAKSAEVGLDVVVETGANIMENAVIKGFCYVGNNVIVGNNAIVRENVSLEENAVIGAQMEIKNSLVMEHATTHSGFIGDSVIGKNCKIAAEFSTGNVRLDRKTVQVTCKDTAVDSHLKNLGVMMSDDVKVGIRVTTMPGVTIGKSSVIGPSTTVMKNVGANAKYYTKFEEVVESQNAKLKTQNKQSKIVLFDIDYTLFNTGVYKSSNLQTFELYEEVQEVFAFLKKKAEVGIFSEGDVSFQKEKLKQTFLEKHIGIDHIHIALKKEKILQKMLNLYKDYEIYLVDDKLEILHKASLLRPDIFTVWVKRGFYADKQKPIKDFAPSITIDDLRGIIAFIK